MSFKFTARLLKTALSNVTLGRPVVFDAQAEGKITGQTKHHTNGDLPMSVVRDSLTRSVDLVAHARRLLRGWWTGKVGPARLGLTCLSKWRCTSKRNRFYVSPPIRSET